MTASPIKRPAVRHWSNPYIGIPYDDSGQCWGLVRRVYAEQLGITLPAYTGAPDDAERDAIATILAGGDGDWREVDEAQPFDLIVSRIGDIEDHCGVVTRTGFMLHVAESITSRVERYNGEIGPRGRILRHRSREADQGQPTVWPFAIAMRDVGIAAGATISDAIDVAFPTIRPEQRARLRVTIGATVVPAELWSRVRPKDWQTVIARIIPGASITNVILGLAITVAAVAIGQYYLGPLIASSLALSSPAAVGAITAATTGVLAIGGELHLNLLENERTA